MICRARPRDAVLCDPMLWLLSGPPPRGGWSRGNVGAESQRLHRAARASHASLRAPGTRRDGGRGGAESGRRRRFWTRTRTRTKRREWKWEEEEGVVEQEGVEDERKWDEEEGVQEVGENNHGIWGGGPIVATAGACWSHGGIVATAAFASKLWPERRHVANVSRRAVRPRRAVRRHGWTHL
eukprot:2640789-Pyramimonas_sp.AAC.1